MTYKELFKIEDFLNVNQSVTVHLEIEKESTFKEAFGETYNEVLDDVKVQGLYIIIIPEDDDDARDTYKGLVNLFDNKDFNSNFYFYRDMLTADLRIAIEANESK